MKDEWKSLAWSLPLDSPPEVVAIGRNAHGFDPVDRYHLPDVWTLHLYGYHATLRLGDKVLPIRPGYAGLVPPDTPMEYRYLGISVHLYVHFRAGSGVGWNVPAMQDLGDGYDEAYRRLFEVIDRFGDQRSKVNARVWDILWQFASTGRAGLEAEGKAHALVERATGLIERRLSEPITVADLAEEIGVSSGYLVRLFRQAYGETVIGYIRRRRMLRAVHLIERSTLPVKTIAASVGLPDLQQFNKAIRAEFGRSPRELRAGGTSGKAER